MTENAHNYAFSVSLDGAPFGNWMKVDGLKVSYDVLTYEEGGQNGYIHKRPGRAKYEDLTFTRPVNEETEALAMWFKAYEALVERVTLEIKALDPSGEEVMTWTFSGAFPVSWSVSGFDASGNAVLTEQLVIATEGFVPIGL
jgi:phage tail-like protein